MPERKWYVKLIVEDGQKITRIEQDFRLDPNRTPALPGASKIIQMGVKVNDAIAEWLEGA